MSDTTIRAAEPVVDAEQLNPIQRAYLVGERPGMELNGPARYYLPCALDPKRVPGMAGRLREMVRDNAVLRLDPSADLFVTTLPERDAQDVDVRVREVGDDRFEAVDDEVRKAYQSDSFAFNGWPYLEVTVVRSPTRARLHLVYALWLMDAASLAGFLAGLVGNVPNDISPAQAPTRSTHRPNRVARDERFWRSRAADLPGPAELPLRTGWRDTGPSMTHRMVTVDAHAARRIEALAATHGLTPTMVHLAVYGTVLGRLGGGAAHSVTVLYSRVTGDAASPGFGNRGNTMPLEIPETEATSFVEIARSVQSRYLSQAMHTTLSGAEIVRLANPGADPRRLAHPFTFTALDTDSRSEAALGLRREWDQAQLRVPQVLIDHQVFREADGTVRMGFDWRTDAFDPGFADDFVKSYERLVTELAEDAERWTRVPVRACVPSPRPPLQQTSSERLHERVLRGADLTPHAPAVHDEQGTLTYAELAGRARATADALIAAGARPGDRVAVHLPRGADQVVAVLGALVAGCVYVPLDHGTPRGRLDSVTRQGRVRFALTGGGAEDWAEDWADRGVLALAPSRETVVRPTPAVKSPDTAYTIFTSGSTGEPKGVVISHIAALNTIDAVNKEFGVTAADRVLSVSSLGFDLSVYDLFGPLLCGGSVVMLSEESAKNPAVWSELLRRHGVTLWNSAPALASLLAEEGAAAPSVRAFLLSGDWIPLALPEALLRLAPDAEVVSLGGATEGSIWSIFHRVAAEDDKGRSIPYGRPLPGQDILILDNAGQNCPDWQIGEIHIAGAGVADGYANDPQRTAAVFVDHPVHGRIYCTGDRGRRLPGGVVEFLGRTDNQVKLHGHRVELGEVEHLLENAPGIREGAVCVQDPDRRARLIAHVTLEENAPASWRQDTIAALKNALPYYMVPELLLEIDEMPLNSNGKLDRRALATLPPPSTPEAEEPTGGHRHDLHEHEIAVCWKEILEREPGKETFFEAGGGSYDAIRFLSALRTGFGHDVSFGEFMADPTVAGLAALCRRPPSSDTPGVWVHRPRSGVDPRFRLVLFPPVGGGVSCYSGLVRRLRGDVNVHVIGLDRPLTGPTDLPELARHCLDELGTLTDGVPNIFAGWSFGGALAYEAARLMKETVTRLVVIDTPVSSEARDGADPTLDHFLHDVRKTAGVRIDPVEAVDPAGVRIDPVEDVDPVLATRFEVYRQNMALLREWTPVPATTPLVELRAARGPAEPDPKAWGQIAPREGALTLTGGHYDVFDDGNEQRIAAAIEGEHDHERY